jgi:hypothetical protein
MSGSSMIARLLTIMLFVFQTTLAVGAESTLCHPHREHSEGNNPGSSREVNGRLFEKHFTTAENLRLEAAKAGAEWLETEDLLNRSKIQANSDHWNAAFQLLQKACLQAELALQQAKTESEAWKRRVID